MDITLSRGDFLGGMEELTVHALHNISAYGMELFLGKRVRINYANAKGEYFGDVIDGVGRATIKLVPKSVKESECTCRVKPYCSHIAAAFYFVAREAGYELKLEKVAVADIREKKEPAKAAGWSAVMREAIRDMLRGRKAVSGEDYVRFNNSLLDSELRRIPDGQRHIASIVSTMQFLKLTEEKLEKLNDYYIMWQAQQDFYSICDLGIKAIFEASRKAMRDDLSGDGFVELVGQSVKEIRNIVFEPVGASRGRIDWSEVYRYIWWHVPFPERLQEQERAWLNKRWNLVKEGPDHYYLLSALLQHALLDGDDESAMKRLKRLSPQTWPRVMEPYLNVFLHSDPIRLREWLLRFKEYVFGVREDQREWYGLIHWYCKLWSDLCIAGSDGRWFAEAQETMQSLLPYSGRVYSGLLLEKGEWEQWADLQLWLGANIAELDKLDLKKVEKARPDLLLPLYHTNIDRYVAHKNRDAYKAAVKLMAAAAKLYKKLKREEEWLRYVERFTARHSRLRALQEELKRSKGIS